MSEPKERTHFLFRIPERVSGASGEMNTALQLGAFAGRLSTELRTRVYAPDLRCENVAEHSNMLAIVAPALAEVLMPHLDANRVAGYCPIHDGVEVYVGDTPTDIITEDGRLSKTEREAIGFKQLKLEFAHLPGFVRRIEEYEQQVIPEARFVRMVDKLMPLITHLNNNCAGLIKDGATPEGIRANSRETADRLRQEYPDMEIIIALREELSELVARIVAHHMARASTD